MNRDRQLAHRLRIYLLPKPFCVPPDVRDAVDNLLKGRWRILSFGKLYPEHSSDHPDLVVHVLARAVTGFVRTDQEQNKNANQTGSRGSINSSAACDGKLCA